MHVAPPQSSPPSHVEFEPTRVNKANAVDTLTSELAMRAVRQTAPFIAVHDWSALSQEVQYMMANDGDADVFVENVRVQVQAPRLKPSKGAKKVGQAGGGEQVWKALRFEGSRPIWSDDLLRVMRELQQHGASISPPHYPHAAEDLDVACRRFVAQQPPSSDGHDPTPRLRVAVFSSITPWVELTPAACLRYSAVLTTVDYNMPVLGSQAQNLNLRTLPQPQLAHACSRAGAAGAFDVAVAFSGIEHDGLGRYGDPTNPYGDLHAMREMWYCLGSAGTLLLAVPTCERDTLWFPGHRIYGPSRLPRLISNFTLRARVWANRTVVGGLEKAIVQPTLWNARCDHREYQQVLVLQKKS
jgi:hypothetical protein